jgi:molybdenum cofactor biosynthesis enzyme MoaA
VTASLRLLQIRNAGVFASTDRTRDQIALEDTPVRFALMRGTEQMFHETCERLRATRDQGTQRAQPRI